MTTTTLDESHLKELFKQAMLELLVERKDVFYDLFAEVIEDAALVNAIREGEADEPVSRSEIFEILGSGA
ncbi:MAG: hypothetical protein HY868_12815 [Chloroflexi bacterium]|nr:hypothetical protein [Chloroflexota bacterium]